MELLRLRRSSPIDAGSVKFLKLSKPEVSICDGTLRPTILAAFETPVRNTFTTLTASSSPETMGPAAFWMRLFACEKRSISILRHFLRCLWTGLNEM